MEVVEETMSGSSDQLPIIRGRRTKRQRPSSPFSSGSTSGGGRGDVNNYENNNYGNNDGGSGSSCPMNSMEEEEDMANCLILLAQGHNKKNSPQPQLQPQPQENIGVVIESYSNSHHTHKPNHNRRTMEPVITDKHGSYVYQCKTCNRCFSSFQALGGHRASHKKPKPVIEDKKAPVVYEDEGCPQFNSLLPQMGNKQVLYSNNKSKVHECSICGSEFSSGQALGGHMRRHRTPTATTITLPQITSDSSMESTKKSRNLLALDLNLPAPEEERDNNNFSFTSKHPSLIFSSPSPLVDCHY